MRRFYRRCGTEILSASSKLHNLYLAKIASFESIIVTHTILWKSTHTVYDSIVTHWNFITQTTRIMYYASKVLQKAFLSALLWLPKTISWARIADYGERLVRIWCNGGRWTSNVECTRYITFNKKTSFKKWKIMQLWKCCPLPSKRIKLIDDRNCVPYGSQPRKIE